MINLYILCTILSLVIFFNNKKIFTFLGLFDHPDNKRKIHKNIISLSGSLFLIVNISLFLIFLFFFNNDNYLGLFYKKRELFSVFFSILSLYFLGFLDDKYNINPWVKLAVTSFFILFVIYTDKNLIIDILYINFSGELYQINLENLSIFFTLVCFVAYLNAVNMFDGINLQIGLYGIFISVCLICLNIFSEINIIIIISILPFLILNFKNKAFIGNSGVAILGFIYGYQYIKGYNFGLIELEEILLLNYLIVIDLLRVTVLRLILGKNPFKADKNHIHHILLKRFKSINVAVITIFLTIIPVVLNLFIDNPWGILFIFTLVYSSIVYFLFNAKKSI